MRFSVSLGLWQDRPPEEALVTAVAAERAGYPELWIGEMATWDSFALATAVGAVTERIGLTLGPLPVTVRDPAMIAMGAASVAGLTGREVGVALGTSSELLVSGWHGRSRRDAAVALAESAVTVRTLLDGGKSTGEGKVVSSRGFRLRLPAPGSYLSIAAFGPAAVDVAARHGDRMVINLVGADTAAGLVRQLRARAEAADREPPPVAAWVVGALDPDEEAIERLRRAVVGYLAAPGYAQMFRAAGFGSIVDFAASGPHPAELLAAVPPELVRGVGLVGSDEQIRAAVEGYREAGVDELVVVPCATAADPAGEATLRAIAELD